MKASLRSMRYFACIYEIIHSQHTPILLIWACKRWIFRDVILLCADFHPLLTWPKMASPHCLSMRVNALEHFMNDLSSFTGFWCKHSALIALSTFMWNSLYLLLAELDGYWSLGFPRCCERSWWVNLTCEGHSPSGGSTSIYAAIPLWSVMGTLSDDLSATQILASWEPTVDIATWSMILPLFNDPLARHVQSWLCDLSGWSIHKSCADKQGVCKKEILYMGSDFLIKPSRPPPPPLTEISHTLYAPKHLRRRWNK